MASKKKPGEREWKIAAVNRMIADEQARISTLQAKLPKSSVAACQHCWNGDGFGLRRANPRCERCGGAGIPSHRKLLLGQLAGARKRLAELKELKRRPGDLLILAHELRDESQLERLRRNPTGSEAVLAALDAEKQRIEGRYGSVDAYFARAAKQRTLAERPRAKGDHEEVAVSELIADLSKRRDENGEPWPPRELWGDLGAAIEAAFGACEELPNAQGMRRYRYPFRGGSRTLSYKQFGAVLAKARRRRG